MLVTVRQAIRWVWSLLVGVAKLLCWFCRSLDLVNKVNCSLRKICVSMYHLPRKAHISTSTIAMVMGETRNGSTITRSDVREGWLAVHVCHCSFLHAL